MLVSSRRLTVPRRGWWFSVLALLAMAAQLAVAVAPLAEGRENRFASHIESGGSKSHVAHNDATCAACQARSIHGTTSRLPAPGVETALHQTVPVAAVTRLATADVRTPTNPRAPPAEI